MCCSPVSRNASYIGVLLIATLALAACKGVTEVRCAVGYPPSLNVTVRDVAGRPQALGAAVTFYDGTDRFLDSTFTESLSVQGGGAGHTYDISVTKRYYADTTVRRVSTPNYDICGSYRPGQVTVPVVLSLVVGAPAVRSLYLLPQRITMDRGWTPFVFASVIDANVGTSHAVRWSIAGDTGSVAFDSATGTLTYRCLKKSGYLTLTATSVADSTVVASSAVAVQGHPAVDNDPPCS